MREQLKILCVFFFPVFRDHYEISIKFEQATDAVPVLSEDGESEPRK